MRKLKLELDSLVVESFASTAARPERGTVRGHVSLYWEDCNPSDTCAGAGWPCDPTDQSCAGTCYENTCHPGCGGTGGTGGGGSDPAITCNGVICVEMDPG
ncbi:MAG TPA: hypothetical protein VFJ16_30990 [Longimicrobium sp.]|nr:hypothetical protein [Longimicrobium sp.]